MSKYRLSDNSSILKKGSTLNDTLKATSANDSRVKFAFPHAHNIRSILENFLENGFTRDFRNLLCSIREWDFTDEDLSTLLKEVTECISMLNSDLVIFINVILAIRWTDRSEKVVNDYQSFLVNLLSAHSYQAKIVIDNLISRFIPGPSEELWENGVPTNADCCKCISVHCVLNTIFKIIPMCKDIFLASVATHFPYFKKGAHINEYFMHNLLWVIDYQPSLRHDILHLIFSKLILMDVNAPREAIQKAYSEAEEDILPFDENRTIASTTYLDSNNVLVETMDICFNRMFNFILTECHNSKTQELDWEKTKGLYKDLMAIFDAIILPTYNSHNIQFCWFFLCGLKTTLAEAFVDHLWKKVVTPNIPAILRRTSVEYIGSLVARASYINLKMLKSIIAQIASWIHAYINAQDGLECVNSDLRIHSVFYSTCQTLFYISTFRHKEMIGSKKNMTFLQSLNFTKIVTSRLNPLRVCQPAVAQNFAAFTRTYQLAYCYSIIEHNSRNIIPTIYQSEKGCVVQTSSVLEANYPFDPCLLRRSSETIRPFYREYEEFDATENKSTEDSQKPEVTETDDFLDQDFDTLNRFSYGSSPGYKLNI